MNAQRSFDLPQQAPQRRDARVLRQPNRTSGDTLGTTKTSPRNRSRVRSNPAYAYRLQGLEVMTKLVTYSTLSVFGMTNLVNLIGYNWAQQSKLQQVETERQDAKIRVDKIHSSFSRSFDPQSQQNAIQENSYKVAPDRRQIFLVNPSSDTFVPDYPSKVFSK